MNRTRKLFAAMLVLAAAVVLAGPATAHAALISDYTFDNTANNSVVGAGERHVQQVAGIRYRANWPGAELEWHEPVCDHGCQWRSDNHRRPNRNSRLLGQHHHHDPADARGGV